MILTDQERERLSGLLRRLNRKASAHQDYDHEQWIEFELLLLKVMADQGDLVLRNGFNVPVMIDVDEPWQEAT